MGCLLSRFKNIFQVSALRGPVIYVGLFQIFALDGKDVSMRSSFPRHSFIVFFLLIYLFFIADFSTLVFHNPFFYYEQFLFNLLQHKLSLASALPSHICRQVFCLFLQIPVWLLFSSHSQFLFESRLFLTVFLRFIIFYFRPPPNLACFSVLFRQILSPVS